MHTEQGKVSNPSKRKEVVDKTKGRKLSEGMVKEMNPRES